MFSIGACSLCFNCVVARRAKFACPRCQRSLEANEQQLLQEFAEHTVANGLAGVYLGPGLDTELTFYQEALITAEDPDFCRAIYEGIKLSCVKCMTVVKNLPRGQSQRLCNDCIDSVVRKIIDFDSDDSALYPGKLCIRSNRKFTSSKFVASVEHFGRQCSYCYICANHTHGNCPHCNADVGLPTKFELKLGPCKLCLESSEICIYKKCSHIVCTTIAESSPDTCPCGKQSNFIKMKLVRRIRKLKHNASV